MPSWRATRRISASPAAGSGTKLSTRPETTASKAASSAGRAWALPSRKAACGSVTCAAACATKSGDGSTPSTADGSAAARTVSLSAPVPQPTSNHRAPAGTPSEATNRRATGRLHRPTYASYRSPPAHEPGGENPCATTHLRRSLVVRGHRGRVPRPGQGEVTTGFRVVPERTGRPRSDAMIGLLAPVAQRIEQEPSKL